MSHRISFDTSVTKSVGSSVDAIAGDASTSVATFRDGLSSAGMCWGGDDFGAAFGAGYLPAANDAAIGAVEHANQLVQAAVGLVVTAGMQETAEDANAEAARSSL